MSCRAQVRWCAVVAIATSMTSVLHAQSTECAIPLITSSKDLAGTAIFAKRGNDHLMITAYHVVRGPKAALFVWTGSEAVAIRQVVEDAYIVNAAADACVFTCRPEGIDALKQAGFSRVPILLEDARPTERLGSDVFAVGAVEEDLSSIVEGGKVYALGAAGTILGSDAVEDDARKTIMLQLDGLKNITYGCSGGPVVADAEAGDARRSAILVGMIQGKERTETYHVAIPASTLIATSRCRANAKLPGGITEGEEWPLLIHDSADRPPIGYEVVRESIDNALAENRVGDALAWQAYGVTHYEQRPVGDALLQQLRSTFELSSQPRLADVLETPSRIQDAAIAPHGRWVAMVTEDRSLRFWSLADKAWIGPPIRSYAGFSAFDVSADGDVLAVGDAVGRVQLWNVSQLPPQRIGNLLTLSGWIEQVKVHSAADQLLVVSRAGVVKLWNYQRRISEEIPQDFGDVREHWEKVEVSDDGQFVATCGRHSVCVWDLDKEDRFQKPLVQVKFKEQRFFDLFAAFSPNSRYAVVPADDGAEVFALPSGNRIGDVSSNRIEHVVFGPDSQRFVTWERTSETVSVYRPTENFVFTDHADVEQGGKVVAATFGTDGQTLHILTESHLRTIGIATEGAPCTQNGRSLAAPVPQKPEFLRMHSGQPKLLVFGPMDGQLRTNPIPHVQLWDEAESQALTGPIRTGRGVDFVWMNPWTLSAAVGSADGKGNFRHSIVGVDGTRSGTTRIREESLIVFQWSRSGRLLVRTSPESSSIGRLRVWEAGDRDWHKNRLDVADDKLLASSLAPSGNEIAIMVRAPEGVQLECHRVPFDEDGPRVSRKIDADVRYVDYLPDSGQIIAVAERDDERTLLRFDSNELGDAGPPIALGDAQWQQLSDFSPDLLFQERQKRPRLVSFEADGEVDRELDVDGSLTSVTFSPDGKYVATVVEGDRVEVWDLATGHSVTGPLSPPGHVTRLTFVGSELVTACLATRGGTDVLRWNLEKGSKRIRTRHYDGDVLGLAGNDKACRLLTRLPNAQFRPGPDCVTVWDVIAGQADLVTLDHGYDDQLGLNDSRTINAASFDSTGERVATASSGSWSRRGPLGSMAYRVGSYHLWDSRSGELKGSPHRVPRSAKSVHFGRQDLSIIGGSSRFLGVQAMVIDRLDPAHLGREGLAMTAPAGLGDASGAMDAAGEAAVFACDGDEDSLYIVSSKGEKVIPLAQYPDIGEFAVATLRDLGRKVRVSANGAIAVTAHNVDGGVYADQLAIWDLKQESLIGSLKLIEEEVRQYSISRDGNYLAVSTSPLAGNNYRVTVYRANPLDNGKWEPDTRKLWYKKQPFPEEINVLEFDNAGVQLLTGDNNNVAQVWDVESGKSRTRALQHDDDVVAGAFSADGLRVATVANTTDDNGIVHVWSVEDERRLSPSLQHDGEVRDLDFSPSGNRIAVTTSMRVTIWPLGVSELQAEDLVDLVEATVGKTIDPVNETVVPLSRTDQISRWRAARKPYPEFFSSSLEKTKRWIRREISRYRNDAIFEDDASSQHAALDLVAQLRALEPNRAEHALHEARLRHQFLANVDDAEKSEELRRTADLYSEAADEIDDPMVAVERASIAAQRNDFETAIPLLTSPMSNQLEWWACLTRGFGTVNAIDPQLVGTTQIELLESSVSDLTQVLDAVGEYRVARLQRGYIWQSIGSIKRDSLRTSDQGKPDYEKAIVDFDTLLEQDPNDAAAAYGRMQSLQGKRDWNGMIEYLEAAVAATQNETFLQQAIYGYVGDAHAELHQWHEAIRAFEGLAEYENATNDMKLALLYARDKSPKYAKLCKKVYEQATNDPQVMDPWFLTALAAPVFSVAPLDDPALEALAKEISDLIGPRTSFDYYQKGILLLRSGDAEGAIPVLQKSIELDLIGSMRVNLYALSIAFAQSGEDELAGEWLEKANTSVDRFRIGNGGQQSLTWNLNLQLDLLRAEAEADLAR